MKNVALHSSATQQLPYHTQQLLAQTRADELLEWARDRTMNHIKHNQQQQQFMRSLEQHQQQHQMTRGNSTTSIASHTSPSATTTAFSPIYPTSPRQPLTWAEIQSRLLDSSFSPRTRGKAEESQVGRLTSQQRAKQIGVGGNAETEALNFQKQTDRIAATVKDPAVVTAPTTAPEYIPIEFPTTVMPPQMIYKSVHHPNASIDIRPDYLMAIASVARENMAQLNELEEQSALPQIRSSMHSASSTRSLGQPPSLLTTPLNSINSFQLTPTPSQVRLSQTQSPRRFHLLNTPASSKVTPKSRTQLSHIKSYTPHMSQTQFSSTAPRPRRPSNRTPRLSGAGLLEPMSQPLESTESKEEAGSRQSHAQYPTPTHEAIAQYLTNGIGATLIDHAPTQQDEPAKDSTKSADNQQNEEKSATTQPAVTPLPVYSIRDINRIIRACSIRSSSVSSNQPPSGTLSRAASLNKKQSRQLARHPSSHTNFHTTLPTASIDRTTPLETFHALMAYYMATRPSQPFPTIRALSKVIKASMRERMEIKEFLTSHENQLFPAINHDYPSNQTLQSPHQLKHPSASTPIIQLRDIHGLIASTATEQFSRSKSGESTDGQITTSVPPMIESRILPLLHDWNDEGYEYDDLNEIARVLKVMQQDAIVPPLHAQPEPRVGSKATTKPSVKDAKLDSSSKSSTNLPPSQQPTMSHSNSNSKLSHNSSNRPLPSHNTVSDIAEYIATTSSEPEATDTKLSTTDSSNPTRSTPKMVPNPILVHTTSMDQSTISLGEITPLPPGTNDSDLILLQNGNEFVSTPLPIVDGPNPLIDFFASPECSFFHPSFASLLSTPQGESELQTLVDTLCLSARVDDVLIFLRHINERNRENRAINRSSFSTSQQLTSFLLPHNSSNNLPVLKFESFEEFAMALGSGQIERLVAPGPSPRSSGEGELITRSPLPAFPGSALAPSRSNSVALSPSLRGTFGRVSAQSVSRFSARTPAGGPPNTPNLFSLPQPAAPGLHHHLSIHRGSLASPVPLTRGITQSITIQRRGSLLEHKNHRRSQSSHLTTMLLPSSQPTLGKAQSTVVGHHSSAPPTAFERKTLVDFFLSFSGISLMSDAFFIHAQSTQLSPNTSELDSLIHACGDSIMYTLHTLEALCKAQESRRQMATNGSTEEHKFASLTELIPAATVVYGTLAPPPTVKSQRPSGAAPSPPLSHVVRMRQMGLSASAQLGSTRAPEIPPSPISLIAAAGSESPQFLTAPPMSLIELGPTAVRRDSTSSTNSSQVPSPLLPVSAQNRHLSEETSLGPGLGQLEVNIDSSLAPSLQPSLQPSPTATLSTSDYLRLPGSYDRTTKLELYTYLSSMNQKLIFHDVLDSDQLLSQIMDQPILGDTLKLIQALVQDNQRLASGSTTNSPREKGKVFPDYHSLLIYIDNKYRSLESLSTQLVLYLTRPDSTLFRRRSHPLDVTIEDVEEFILLDAGVVDVHQYVHHPSATQHFPKTSVRVRELFQIIHSMESSGMVFDTLHALSQSIRISWQVKKNIQHAFAGGRLSRTSSTSHASGHGNRSSGSTGSSGRSSMSNLQPPTTPSVTHPIRKTSLTRQTSDTDRSTARHRRQESRDRRHTRDGVDGDVFLLSNRIPEVNSGATSLNRSEGSDHSSPDHSPRSSLRSSVGGIGRGSLNHRAPLRHSIMEEHPAVDESAAIFNDLTLTFPSIHLTDEEEEIEKAARVRVIKLLQTLPPIKPSSPAGVTELSALLPLCSASHMPFAYLEKFLQDIRLQQKQIHLSQPDSIDLLTNFDQVLESVEQAEAVLSDRKSTIHTFLQDGNICSLWSPSSAGTPILPSAVDRLFSLRRTPHIESYNLVIQFLQTQLVLQRAFKGMDDLCEQFKFLQESWIERSKAKSNQSPAGEWNRLFTFLVNDKDSTLLPSTVLLSSDQAEFMTQSCGASISTIIYLVQKWDNQSDPNEKPRCFNNWSELELALAHHTEPTMLMDHNGESVGRRESAAEQARMGLQRLLQQLIQDHTQLPANTLKDTFASISISIISALIDAVAIQLTSYNMDPSIDVFIHTQYLLLKATAKEFYSKYLQHLVPTANAPVLVVQLDVLQADILASMSSCLSSAVVMDGLLEFVRTQLSGRSDSIIIPTAELKSDELINLRVDSANERRIRARRSGVVEPELMETPLKPTITVNVLAPSSEGQTAPKPNTPITPADIDALRMRLTQPPSTLLHSSLTDLLTDATIEELIHNGGHSLTFTHLAVTVLNEFGSIDAHTLPNTPTTPTNTKPMTMVPIDQPPFSSIEQLNYAVRLAKFQSYTDKQEILLWMKHHPRLLPEAQLDALNCRPDMDVLYETTQVGFLTLFHLRSFLIAAPDATQIFESFTDLITSVRTSHDTFLNQLHSDRDRMRAMLRGEVDLQSDFDIPSHTSPHTEPAILSLKYPEKLGLSEVKKIHNCLNISIDGHGSSLDFGLQLVFRLQTVVPFLLKLLREARQLHHTVDELITAVRSLHREYVRAFDTIHKCVDGCGLIEGENGPAYFTPAYHRAIHELLSLELQRARCKIATATNTTHIVLATPIHLTEYLAQLLTQGRRFKSLTEILPELRECYSAAAEKARQSLEQLQVYLLSPECTLLTTRAKRAIEEDSVKMRNDLEKLFAIGEEFKITALYLVRLLNKTRTAAAQPDPPEALASSIGDLFAPVQTLSTNLQARHIELLVYIQSPAHIHLLLATTYTKHLADLNMFHLREIEDKYELDVIETLTAIDQQRKDEAAEKGEELTDEFMFQTLHELEAHLDRLIQQEYGASEVVIDQVEEPVDELVEEVVKGGDNAGTTSEIEPKEEQKEVDQPDSIQPVSVSIDTSLPPQHEPTPNPYDDLPMTPKARDPLFVSLIPIPTTPNKTNRSTPQLSNSSPSDSFSLTSGEAASFHDILSSPTQRVAQEIRAKVEEQARRLESRRAERAKANEQSIPLEASPSMRVLLTTQAAKPTNERALSPVTAARFSSLPVQLFSCADGLWRDKRGVEEVEYRESSERIKEEHNTRAKMKRAQINKILTHRSKRLSSNSLNQLKQPLTTQLPIFSSIITLSPSSLWLSQDKPERRFNIRGSDDYHLCVKISLPDSAILRDAFSLNLPDADGSTTGSSSAHTIYQYIRPGLSLSVGVATKNFGAEAPADFVALFANGSNDFNFDLTVEVCILNVNETARSQLPPAKSKAKLIPRLPQRNSLASPEQFWLTAVINHPRMTQLARFSCTYDRGLVVPSIHREMVNGIKPKATLSDSSSSLSSSSTMTAAAAPPTASTSTPTVLSNPSPPTASKPPTIARKSVGSKKITKDTASSTTTKVKVTPPKPQPKPPTGSTTKSSSSKNTKPAANKSIKPPASAASQASK